MKLFLMALRCSQAVVCNKVFHSLGNFSMSTSHLVAGRVTAVTIVLAWVGTFQRADLFAIDVKDRETLLRCLDWIGVGFAVWLRRRSIPASVERPFSEALTTLFSMSESRIQASLWEICLLSGLRTWLESWFWLFTQTRFEISYNAKYWILIY